MLTNKKFRAHGLNPWALNHFNSIRSRNQRRMRSRIQPRQLQHRLELPDLLGKSYLISKVVFHQPVHSDSHLTNLQNQYLPELMLEVFLHVTGHRWRQLVQGFLHLPSPLHIQLQSNNQVPALGRRWPFFPSLRLHQAYLCHPKCFPPLR